MTQWSAIIGTASASLGGTQTAARDSREFTTLQPAVLDFGIDIVKGVG